MMNVSMNIEDRAGLYGEMYRVLRPGGWLVLSEIAQGPTTGLSYPIARARSDQESFLLTPEATQDQLEAAGFERSGTSTAMQRRSLPGIANWAFRQHSSFKSKSSAPDPNDDHTVTLAGCSPSRHSPDHAAHVRVRMVPRQGHKRCRDHNI
jgi:hypothetical protein